MEHNHMLGECPPSYASHDPQSLNLPSIPTAEPPPIHHDRVLPPLPPMTVEQKYRQEPVSEVQSTWPSSNPLTAYYQPGPSQLSPKTTTRRNTDSPNAMDLDISENRARRGGSVLSIDDPDVRLAAEALGDLRADFIQSPPHPHNNAASNSPRFRQGGSTQPEPLLSLLTTSHPFIGNAIGGSLSAYSASKNYSPRFKSSAEYVERRISPVVNTINSVNRITGVEGGVRWFLGGRRPSHHGPSDTESDSPSHKRRKVNTSAPSDLEGQPMQFEIQFDQQRRRRPSQVSTTDSLPAYDDQRSPSYEATQQALIPSNRRSDESASPGSSWQSRLVLSTSGLSVAMSEESLRSLKYCLSWIRWANEHIGKLIVALKSVLEQYDNSGTIADTPYSDKGTDNNQRQVVLHTDDQRSALTAKIAQLNKDVLKTLKEVVDIVSKYAGGALPENARDLVRRHLTSLPRRFQIANSVSNSENRSHRDGESEAKEGAQRVMVLAKEGLDMMTQVSGVLDGTIVSAEEWCEKLGRKKRDEREAATPRNEKMANDGSESEMMEMLPVPSGDVKVGYTGLGEERPTLV
ncbi:hypothetical protein SS1G_03781 [Sclerotinia sclerotiorum 1980 UF-70]|uniref:Clock-controlled protein 8 n=2 Tax=Sclerotinia sclerotiorum (strain ATCC 18683 / 1980 / Ss-1) TaxID=665079 RepID=A7EEP1_SCLS1|nr:hypothetical protein SS1G_03781 [Sclerotinia sclerotiorum 1980 UF-70]APA12579.1 hypothetical protein sscle_09g073490 [Sclerotinia sclerotiorum 1980 UF-70]EDO01307.1 hypothetical protein SS1G_03781 [Sclerotinia sclerotiorum 1980 UF-70]